MSWREFRFVRKGKAPLVWMIRQDGESYQTQHGQLDGAMQLNQDTPGPKGKENTKSYVNAFDNCVFHVNREIRKKKENGYIEYVDGEPTEKQITEMSFDDYLPKNFVAYKPQTDIKPKALEKLHSKGMARYTRKYDGFCTLMVHHAWGWEVYSRRMDVMTEHFPKQVQELESIDWLGAGTILIGEMLCLKGELGSLDDFKTTSRVCRSKPDKSLELRSSRTDEESGEEHPPEAPEPVFIIFDILYLNGEDFKDKTYDDRSAYWKKDFPTIQTRSDELIVGVDYFDLTPDNWMDLAKANHWEGFVVTDGSAKLGEKAYNFSGKPKRPLGSHKLKPVYEADVVVYAGLRGTGKRINGAGSVFVKQLHPETGEWFDCGKVGGGWSDEALTEMNQYLADHDLPIIEKMGEAKKLDFKNLTGFTIEIEYSDRHIGTNKFRYPQFQRFRFDKEPEECEAQRLAPEEE